jgi:glycerol uptake facilitator-like aquaporin
VVHFFLPDVILIGPNLKTDPNNGTIVEFFLGFFLMGFVIIGSKKIFGTRISGAVIVAIGIRILLLLENGKYTGASLNPLFATGWEFYRDHSALGLTKVEDQLAYCLHFIFVYIIAPTIGASFACIVFNDIFPDPEPKEKVN